MKNEDRNWEKEFLSSENFRKISLEDTFKQEILKLCKHLKIETISDFYDLIFKAQRNHCQFSAGENNNCFDGLGKSLAFSLDNIQQVFKVTKCMDICKLGCCSPQNNLAKNIFYELAEQAGIKTLKEFYDK